jgi:ATP phosphoribosyltransferase regulatory subunit
VVKPEVEIMGRWKKSIPEGTRDILFLDCAHKKHVESLLKGVYLQRGFMEIITPTLEFYDIYAGESLWIDQENMYKLFDSKGRILVLRPDITTPIARLAGTKLKESFYPLKLCYSQNVFRTNENLNGKRNEFTQSGVELIGCKGLRADLEVIITAIKALLVAGVENFKLELGHVGFFKGIMDELPLEKEDKESIRRFIENKNFAALRDFLNDKSEVLTKEKIDVLNMLPALFGDISLLERAKKLTSSPTAIEALNEIQKIYKMLEGMKLSKYISFDLGMVHHINYYTGLIFRAYIDGTGYDVLYGGRYDGLVSNFGIEVPATGFAINVDRILEVLKKENYHISGSITPYYIIHCSEENLGQGNELLEDLVKKGYKCELSLYSEKEATIDYAKKREIDNVLFLDGEKEVYRYNITKDTLELFVKVEE